MAKKEIKKSFFERFSAKVTNATGSTPAFIIACLLVIVWGATGPIFNYSETWQLVINTGTTIITFLMVFLIQKSQNKDSMAIQLKLNELIASSDLSSNRLVDVEDLSEDEMKTIRKYYERLSDLTEKDNDMKVSHSIEEAQARYDQKKLSRSKNSEKKAV
ncbi:MAG: low affinity iron permease family protein [Chitinophagaceae bacterium]